MRTRDLGQNFLVDRNILDVIERLAALAQDDVVLEVGGGLGVLSVRLAQRVGRLHLIEIDHRLEERLRVELGGFPGATLWMGDAVTFDLSVLEPPPTKMVANLPYGVAATVILRTIEQLPSILSWVVMVQREVGERFAAAPGRGAYGVPSVLAQLACDVRVLRPVSRTVFRPVPHVDSVLLGLTRRAGSGSSDSSGSDVSSLVHAAFAHRRKALAGSLALAPGAAPEVRERARSALVELGLPADARAEQLAPEQFRALAAKL
ncbi:MAG TPA: 16S rRNA (adenine(1518)-N(6)/adenine(1519)-N(6))-dimethyltransferase RsmA [Solirubrobacteraceae bacterium]|nr:16S rRNA (adenine(1518)-N(6)/adenine(1519)-N(6))-dimethyltransferase RsmA [Solirubrobacteraceae bacterium]